mmetsp:Transcript_46441/g.132389  ORF Transcript_46441/g.132389 Transcript_46441/m.132389 type:complete len:96 (+) Transcript_46441:2372-2659(+)
MTTVVRPCMTLSKASCTSRSVSVSRALVASSINRTAGSLSTARAIATRCFWPPERDRPSCETSVSSPCGRWAANLATPAMRAASPTRAALAAGAP